MPRLPDNEFFTGVTEDPRLDPKIIDGWSINEILAESATLNWRKKTISERVNFPVWNQHQTSACVAFAKAKQVSIRIFNMTGVWIDFSPASIYQLRVNAPGLGMNIADANDIVNKRGTTLEALMRSQNLTEAQIMTVQRSKVAEMFAEAIAEAVVRYLYVPPDIDRIAQTIESGKAVSLLIYGTFDEYARMTPVVLNPNLTYTEAPVRHEVVGVDYFLDGDGAKKILINDSAHFGGLSLREFSEDFIARRCVLADAIDVFTFNPETGDKPSYDGSIISLQKCLRYEGLFPEGTDFVENFGPITQDGVMKFQVKHKLHATGVPSVGPLTKAKLLELYP